MESHITKQTMAYSRREKKKKRKKEKQQKQAEKKGNFYIGKYATHKKRNSVAKRINKYYSVAVHAKPYLSKQKHPSL